MHKISIVDTFVFVYIIKITKVGNIYYCYILHIIYTIINNIGTNIKLYYSIEINLFL